MYGSAARVVVSNVHCEQASVCHRAEYPAISAPTKALNDKLLLNNNNTGHRCVVASVVCECQIRWCTAGAISGVAIGKRHQATITILWRWWLAQYRQCAVCYTGLQGVYLSALPSKRHRVVAKEVAKPIIVRVSTTPYVSTVRDCPQIPILFKERGEPRWCNIV